MGFLQEVGAIRSKGSDSAPKFNIPMGITDNTTQDEVLEHWVNVWGQCRMVYHVSRPRIEEKEHRSWLLQVFQINMRPEISFSQALALPFHDDIEI